MQYTHVNCYVSCCNEICQNSENIHTEVYVGLVAFKINQGYRRNIQTAKFLQKIRTP